MSFIPTVGNVIERGDEVVVAHDGQPGEHVDGQEDVEDEAAVATLGLVEDRMGELGGKRNHVT